MKKSKVRSVKAEDVRFRLVLSGNSEQFKYFFPEPERNLVNVRYVEELYGHRNNPEFIRVGTWWNNDQRLIDAFEMFEREHHYRNFIPKKPKRLPLPHKRKRGKGL